MAASFKADSSASLQSEPLKRFTLHESDSDASYASFTSDYSTVFRAGRSAPYSTGVVRKRHAPRKRPPKAVRLQKSREVEQVMSCEPDPRREDKQIMGCKKRKCAPEDKELSSNVKALCLKVVVYL
ncbi:unnamed protein product [Eruca vesicaria subsp. sativa]|uniref:Uncharacterized protein n=1 Tax=Eruca vesicaria subsp. sativa TaxID=29727 RepID=A0ABC8JHJ2_ERUVS|nr:unnamed protein product [Eruca vesicaria subsp. sativa]